MSKPSQRMQAICLNCHWADLQFKNLVLDKNGVHKYVFDKSWDMSLEDPLKCHLPLGDFQDKEVADNFTCNAFRPDKQRESDTKAGC